MWTLYRNFVWPPNFQESFESSRSILTRIRLNTVNKTCTCFLTFLVASMCTNDRVQSLDSSFSSSANLAVNTTGIGYDSTGSCSCSAIITNNNELQNMSVTVSSIRILDRAVRDTSSNLTSACSSSFRILTENRSYKYACQSPQVSFTVMTNQRFGLEYHKTTGNDGGNYCIRTSFSSRSLIRKYFWVYIF